MDGIRINTQCRFPDGLQTAVGRPLVGYGMVQGWFKERLWRGCRINWSGSLKELKMIEF